MVNPESVAAAKEVACAAHDILCHMDQHEGTAAYLQAVLSVGVAAVTAVWALIQGDQRRRDAKLRWRAHIASITALVDFAESEINRLEELMTAAEFGGGDENPESRYLTPARTLIKDFPILHLPNEWVVRSWLDFRWELGIFNGAMSTAWNCRRGNQPGVEAQMKQAREAAARAREAALAVRSACRVASHGEPAKSVIAQIPDLIEAI